MSAARLPLSQNPGKFKAASKNAQRLKKSAPVQATLCIFGKNAWKWSPENHWARYEFSKAAPHEPCNVSLDEDVAVFEVTTGVAAGVAVDGADANDGVVGGAVVTISGIEVCNAVDEYVAAGVIVVVLDVAVADVDASNVVSVPEQPLLPRLSLSMHTPTGQLDPCHAHQASYATLSHQGFTAQSVFLEHTAVESPSSQLTVVVVIVVVAMVVDASVIVVLVGLVSVSSIVVVPTSVVLVPTVVVNPPSVVLIMSVVASANVVHQGAGQFTP